MLAQPGVGVDEDDPLFPNPLGFDGKQLRFHLRGHAGDEALLLGLGDAEAVIGGADVLGQFLPGGGLLLGGLHEVLDVLEVDAGQVAPHCGIGFLSNSRRAFSRRSVIHWGSFCGGRCRGRPRRSGRAGQFAPASSPVGPAVFVVAQALQSGVEVFDALRHRSLRSVGMVLDGAGSVGMKVDADVVAVREGGEALDVYAERSGEGFGLGVAELRNSAATDCTGQCPGTTGCQSTEQPLRQADRPGALASKPSRVSALTRASTSSPVPSRSANSTAYRFSSFAIRARAKEATAAGPAVSARKVSASLARWP